MGNLRGLMVEFRIQRRPSLRRTSRSSGQDLVEYALVLPLLMLLVLGIIEFGFIVWSQNTLANAAREGARLGVVLYPFNEAAIEARAKERALGLDDTALQADATRVGKTVTVEMIYLHRLLTAPIVQVFGGSPTVPLRAVSRMRTEY